MLEAVARVCIKEMTNTQLESEAGTRNKFDQVVPGSWLSGRR